MIRVAVLIEHAQLLFYILNQERYKSDIVCRAIRSTTTQASFVWHHYDLKKNIILIHFILF